MDTRIDLVAELESFRETEARNALVRRAAEGDFHDFCSNNVAPKHALVEALIDAQHATQDARYGDLAKRVVDGEFDDDWSAT